MHWLLPIRTFASATIVSIALMTMALFAHYAEMQLPGLGATSDCCSPPVLVCASSGAITLLALRFAGSSTRLPFGWLFAGLRPARRRE